MLGALGGASLSADVRPVDHAMNYKISCPSCGTKVSRWHIFCEPALHHRCRKCDARIRVGLIGWLATFAVVAVQILWFVLYRRHLISLYLAIGLLLVTCGLAIWILPYLTPVHLVRQADTTS